MQDAQKKWAFAGVLMVLFLASLNLTVVGTTLPRAVAELGGIQLYSWAFSGYFLTSTLVLVTSGKLGDLYGRKKLMLVGILLFCLGSVLLTFTPSMPVLILFRALQGLGGGLLIGTAFATVADLFSGAERTRYQGLTTSAFGLSSVVGPLVGGVITDHFGWRLVFLVNLPVGLLAFWFIHRFLQDVQRSRGGRLDVPGLLLLSCGTTTLLLGLTLLGQQVSPAALALLLGAVLTLLAFVWWEQKAQHPMVDLGLFKNRSITISNVAGFLTIATMQSCIFYLPLFFQSVQNMPATTSGLLLTPLMVGQGVTSVLAGLLVSRVGGARLLILLGAGVSAVALLLTATVQPTTPAWQVMEFMVLLGMGMGPVMSLLTIAVQNAAPAHQLGMATSLSQFSRQLGGTVFVTVLGVLLNRQWSAHLSDHLPGGAHLLSPQLQNQMQDSNTLSNPLTLSSFQRDLQTMGHPELALPIVTGLKALFSESVQHLFGVTAALGVLALLVLLALPGFAAEPAEQP